MNLKQLETFLTVAKTESFIRTAEQLYLSQPAVTQQIQSMENELGFPLFVRTKHTVKLTPAGRGFLSGAEQIISIYRDTLKICSQIAEGTPACTIHYVGNANLHHLPNILKGFHTLFPSCHIATQRISPDRAIVLLLNGSIRLLLVPEELVKGHREIIFQPLYQAGYYAVMSAEHPLTQFPELSIEQLAGYVFLIPEAEFTFQHMGDVHHNLETMIPGFRRISVTGIDDAFAQMLYSQNIAIMPEYTCPRHPDLVSIPLSLNENVTYGVAYKDALTFMEKKLVEYLYLSFQNMKKVDI